MSTPHPTTALKTRQVDDLNTAQREAVTHGAGPLLIIAGAGTGKTTVITRRIAWLIMEQGLKPQEVLALTFTDKAAGEMEERVDRLLPYGYVELWISTFHSFAERILKAHALDIGLPADFELLDTTAAWLLIHKNLHRFNLKYYKPLGNPTKFIHALLTHFSRAKDELIGPREYLEYVENLKLNRDSDIVIGGSKVASETRADEIARLEEIANAYHVYEQLLLEENALDFGSLITRTIELLRKRPHILAKYREQFKYILVDEFQDTNIAQYELVKLLAAPKNNLTVVGDDDQAIYKFRGASISNILEFKKDFPRSQELFLIENYRTKQNILDLAYAFIGQNNPNRLEVRLGTAGLSKKLVAATGKRGIITHIHADTMPGESRMVVETLRELKHKDAATTWNDFAILVRANDHAAPFIIALDEARVPYELVTARGLYAKPVILDLLAYAKLLDDYHESPALYRVLTSPVVHLEEVDITNLIYWANRKSWSIFATMRQAGALGFSSDAVTECNRITSLIEKHTALARRARVSQVIFVILEETGYLKFLSREETGAERNALRHLNQFYRLVTQFESDHTEPTLKHFLDDIELEIESGERGRLDWNPEEGPEAVKILTCHAAKGLEFRYVFVTNLVDRRFPSVERREPIELPDALVKEIVPEGDIHLEEERRLFYVACTRAKDGLFFTSAADYGGTRKKKFSRFLLELRELGCMELRATPSLSSAAPARRPQGLGLRSLPRPLVPELALGRKGRGSNRAPSGLETRSGVDAKLPTQFSFTQLKAFETCPLQYKYQHILKIPVKGRPTFSFGKTIHRTLQKFCDLLRTKKASQQTNLFDKKIVPELVCASGALAVGEEGLPKREELYKLYDESWIDDWFDDAAQKKAYYEKGRELLKLFYEEAQKNPPNPLYLEQSFHLKIDGYTLKGVIDRVDARPDGTLEIIDYKTGASREEGSVDKDQLYIYQLALEELLGGKPGALTFYYVEDGKKVTFLGTSLDLANLKKKIITQIEAIKKSSFPATPSKEKCRHCDFKNICEFRIL